MLRQLYIQHFTLINELKIDFTPGFSVITGETGAGKSIILGAIGLLLGNRADSRMVKEGEKKCTVEAHFDITNYHLQDFFVENDIDDDPSDCILRRELTSSGKSRAFINDTPVSLATIKQLGEQLVDIHSQHQNFLLQTEDFQLQVVDIIARNEGQLNDYREAYEAFRQKEKEFKELQQRIEKSKENEAFITHELNEIQAAGLEEGQQEALEARNEILTHYEDILTSLQTADQLLGDEEQGVLTRIKSTLASLRTVETVYPAIKDLCDRLDTSFIELKDIAREISGGLESIDFDPSELERINDQLNRIYTLEHKYHVNEISQILTIRDDLAKQLRYITNSDEELDSLHRQLAEAQEACEQKAQTISALRVSAAQKVEREAKHYLEALGIPNVRFSVDISRKALSHDGIDKIVFLFSANKSSAMQPISQVASGGEIARVMLSLKAMISGTVKLPTIIFDEIDIGVSGRIAEQMAGIMKEMGDEGRQVISITHLPQIAARGAAHYKVEKEETDQGTISRMRLLTMEERVTEIAQMLSGSQISKEAISNAKVLLKLNA